MADFFPPQLLKDISRQKRYQQNAPFCSLHITDGITEGLICRQILALLPRKFPTRSFSPQLPTDIFCRKHYQQNATFCSRPITDGVIEGRILAPKPALFPRDFPRDTLCRQIHFLFPRDLPTDFYWKIKNKNKKTPFPSVNPSVIESSEFPR